MQMFFVRHYKIKCYVVGKTDKTQYNLIFQFQNRSISVFLRACRVVFRVEYAASTLEIVAGGRHCLGRPTHVQAIRLFHKDKLEKGTCLFYFFVLSYKGCDSLSL